MSMNAWHHIGATYDGQDVKLFLDGAMVKEESHPGAIPTNNTDVRLGAYANETTYWFTGRIDDARIYNRALSAQEMQQLYMYGVSGGLGDVSGNCSNPSRPEGVMVYNIDHNVMQYCNGEEWIRIGQ